MPERTPEIVVDFSQELVKILDRDTPEAARSAAQEYVQRFGLPAGTVELALVFLMGATWQLMRVDRHGKKSG